MVLKVSSKSNPNAVAGMMANILKEHNKCELQCIGAGAVNQSVKAIIIAKSFLSLLGKNIIMNPSFTEIDIDGVMRTAIKIIVEAI